MCQRVQVGHRDGGYGNTRGNKGLGSQGGPCYKVKLEHKFEGSKIVN